MDDRVRLVQRIGQTPVIEVKRTDMDALGLDGVAAGIRAHGIEPEHLGEPFDYRGRVRIPVRRDE